MVRVSDACDQHVIVEIRPNDFGVAALSNRWICEKLQRFYRLLTTATFSRVYCIRLVGSQIMKIL